MIDTFKSKNEMRKQIKYLQEQLEESQAKCKRRKENQIKINSENKTLKLKLEQKDKEIEEQIKNVKFLENFNTVTTDKLKARNEKLERVVEAVKYYLNADTDTQVADARFQMEVTYDDLEAWEDNKLNECEHGKGLTDYCLECGRVHSE